MTPSIPKSALIPLIRKVWSDAGFGTALPDAFAWSCRGYYRDSLGKPGVNDRGINDDAIGFISPDVDYRIQANVDPSVYRTGVSSLVTNQVVWYRPGWHGYASIYGHQAFRQDSAVTVRRDGTEGFKKGTVHKKYGVCLGGGLWTDLGFGERFWTNLHRQSGNTTSSLGCQTVPAVLWKAFHALVMAELARVGQDRFPCIILEGPIN
jgi:lysozyme